MNAEWLAGQFGEISKKERRNSHSNNETKIVIEIYNPYIYRVGLGYSENEVE